MSDPIQPRDVASFFDVGARLLAQRQIRGLSQRELARRAGITNANLSMIEQGRVSPSVITLEKILLALELSLTEFFSATSETTPDVFSYQTLTLVKRGDSEYRLLPPAGDGEPYLLQQILAPGAVTTATWFGRKAWVSGILQSGELILWIDSCRHDLLPGDAFRFHLQRSHKFANETANPTKLVMMIVDADL